MGLKRWLRRGQKAYDQVPPPIRKRLWQWLRKRFARGR